MLIFWGGGSIRCVFCLYILLKGASHLYMIVNTMHVLMGSNFFGGYVLGGWAELNPFFWDFLILHNDMEYIVHGSKNQNDSNFKLTSERVC